MSEGEKLKFRVDLRRWLNRRDRHRCTSAESGCTRMSTQVLEESLKGSIPVESGPAPSEYLEAQLRQRLGSRVRDVRVVLRHDGVILQGWTATYHAKQLAQHAAMELADMRILANEIEVEVLEERAWSDLSTQDLRQDIS